MRGLWVQPQILPGPIDTGVPSYDTGLGSTESDRLRSTTLLRQEKGSGYRRL